jgi:hypothetical protein
MTRHAEAIKELRARLDRLEARNGGPPLAEPPDPWVPDPDVQEEFSIGPMGLWRWDHDPKMTALGWPPPIYVRKRKFRSRRKLDAFKAELTRRSIRDRKEATS